MNPRCWTMFRGSKPKWKGMNVIISNAMKSTVNERHSMQPHRRRRRVLLSAEVEEGEGENCVDWSLLLLVLWIMPPFSALAYR